MANQSYWNKIAQEELAKGQKMQDVSRMAAQDRDRYLAARRQHEQQQQQQQNKR